MTTIRKAVKSSFKAMVQLAKAAGFNLVGDQVHPVKYVCPECYRTQAQVVKKAKKEVKPVLLRLASKRAVVFVNGRGVKMAACNVCGYRKLEGDADIPDAPINPIDAAQKGMRKGIADLKNKGRCLGETAKGVRCALKAGAHGYCRYHGAEDVVNTTANPGF